MALYFVDTAGNRGTISDELTVSYRGPDDVTESLESCIEATRSEEDSVEDVFRTLFTELPEQCPVREVGRADQSSLTGGPVGE